MRSHNENGSTRQCNAAAGACNAAAGACTAAAGVCTAATGACNAAAGACNLAAGVSGESRVLHRKSQNVCRSFEKQSMSKTIEIMIRRTHPKLPVGALEIGVFIKPPKLLFDKAT